MRTSTSWSSATRTLACTSDTYPAGRVRAAQGATLDELRANLQEVLEMLLEDGEPKRYFAGPPPQDRA
jgi:hypothetical protein